VVGAGDGGLRFDYTSDLSDVAIGDTLVTSGIDGIFPKGWALGRVASIEKVSGAYRQIVVEPGVDFTRLEEVLVVVAPPAAREEAAEAGP
jgi:rod shape-determining protein MreC